MGPGTASLGARGPEGWGPEGSARGPVDLEMASPGTGTGPLDRARIPRSLATDRRSHRPSLAMLSCDPLPAEPGAPHLFSVDVEDYFQANAFDPWVDRAAWDGMPSRVERNTDRLLELLARFGVRGTFFTVGWVATRFPGLVRRIAEAGHEVASHGHWHRRVSTLGPGEFRRDLRDSKAALEEASGRACRGFRAPTFSIRPGGEWALEILVEEGFRYDSSLFPIRRPDYGYPGIPLVPHRIRTRAGELLELPLAVLRWGRLTIPAAGGGYLRQLPYGLTARAFRRWESAGYSAMFYTHPWEIDPGQPRLSVGLVTRLRHYRGLEKTWPRLERILGEFRFTSVAGRYGPLLGAPAPAPRPAA